jgi:hypothetical protein
MTVYSQIRPFITWLFFYNFLFATFTELIITIKHNIMKQLFLAAALLVIGFSNAQVKIGDNPTTMNPASLLELESTTQGFLPPRMSKSQMNLIGSPGTPALGMQVWCIDCSTMGEQRVYNGTAWTILSNGKVGGFTHYLGEAFNDGIIYYLYKGSDGLEHGLIVALTESTAVAWQTVSTLTNADRTWDGAHNTNLMTNSPSKTYIETLGSGWYLPSIDELSKLYYSRFEINKALFNIGKTLLSKMNAYWSSTESISGAGAYNFNFKFGLFGAATKLGSVPVRGVRSF